MMLNEIIEKKITKIRTINCTGLLAQVYNEDDLPPVKAIKLNGFYHVGLYMINGYKCYMVRINGQWFDMMSINENIINKFN